MTAENKKPKDLPKQGSTTDKEQKAATGIAIDVPHDSAMAALFNQGIKIKFTHVPTGYEVEFPGMLTSFDDSFNANFSGTPVYGRMDQIAVYTGTTRLINFGFDIVCTTVDEAKQVLGRIGQLESFMYPAYDGDGSTGTSTISAAPLLRIKFGNLIQASSGQGLLGYANVVNTAPNFDSGFVVDKEGKMYPKAYTLNITFNVLHEHELGWHKSGESWKWRGDKSARFPYDRNLPDGQTTNNTKKAATKQESKDTNTSKTQPKNASNEDGASPDNKSRTGQKVTAAKHNRMMADAPTS